MASLNHERRKNAVVAFISVAGVVPLVWMLMDRDPPYVRTDGEIVAADPADCGLPENTSRGIDAPIRAGACVEVKWSIKAIRNCPASSGGDNVVRHLKDSLGVTKTVGSLHRSGPLHETSGATTTTPITENEYVVKQYMTLPLPMPAGPATYISSACFACNPLQHLFWPVCIDTPDIDFEVTK